jgi:hypothetical protein
VKAARVASSTASTANVLSRSRSLRQAKDDGILGAKHPDQPSIGLV